MPLHPGARLGPYEIVGVLGAGGMGEVYRATDTNLARQVAIKVLPAAVAADADRLARFDREAKTLASLNHPNIAAIYGLERAGGQTALVMELVEGPTLGDRIAQGAVPLDEVMPIARQIAQGLEAAHEQGIVHRDLKPANIKLRTDGAVKVLDFGLAKSVAPVADASSDASQSPTITTPAMTHAGVILGTATYMSPEQAKGRPADKRSDIWAFGVVLYEMLTGRRAFVGDDVTDTLAAVLRAEPNWSALPSETPPAVVACLKRCLQKDPRQRVRDIGDVRLVLDGAFDTPQVASHVVSTPRRGIGLTWAAIAVGLSALIAGALVWFLRPAPAKEQTVARFGISLADDDLMPGAIASLFRVAALSPDERSVVYVSANQNGESQLVRRSLADLESVTLPDTRGGSQPFFSPDGLWMGFFDRTDTTLKKVAIAGGKPIEVCDVPDTPHAAVWLPDGSIIFGQHLSPLLRVPETGGNPVPLLTLEAGEEDHDSPSFVPGGRGIVFGSYPTGAAPVPMLYSFSFEDGVRHKLTEGWNPHVTPEGHLVFIRDGSLWAAPFDLDRLVTTGEPQPVLSHASSTTHVASFALGRTGTLVYHAGVRADDATGVVMNDFAPVWVTREGVEEPLPLPSRPFEGPRVSPDGQRLAISIPSARPGENDLWVYDVRTGAGVRLTHEGNNRVPIWTADGKRIVFSSTLGAPRPEGFVGNWFGNLYQVESDGNRDSERLTNSPGTQALSGISPNGRQLFFTSVVDSITHWELTRIDLDRGGEETRLAPGPFRRASGEVSPDGQLISYRSDETGVFEIYVQTYPSLDAKTPVSVGGGEEPVWSANSRELFYRIGERVMAVEIGRLPTLRASAPRELFSGNYKTGTGARGREYHVAPDGRFLMLKLKLEDPNSEEPDYVVVLNWFEELKARLR